MAGAELQSKLEKRLMLQKEATSPSAKAKGHWQPPAVVHRGGPESAAERRLREQIDLTAVECREARQQKQSIEATAMAHGIELGAEVARLRVDVEVLRKDLLTAQDEVHRLRAGSHLEHRRERAMQEHACRMDMEHAAAEARRQALATEVRGSCAERLEIESQVKALETEVQQQVIDRVRLEAMLRASEVREAELRRLLEAAEVGGKGPQFANVGASATSFALDSSEDEGPDQTDDDLEFSYEGLELSGLMSLERALQLARRRGGGPADEDGGSARADSDGGDELTVAGSLGEEEREGDGLGGAASSAAAAAAEDSLYEAPLRELEIALARLLGSGVASAGSSGAGIGDPATIPPATAGSAMGGGGGGNAASAPQGMPALRAVEAAGTGEATVWETGDMSAYEEHLGQLQQALLGLGAATQPASAAAAATEAAAAAERPSPGGTGEATAAAGGGSAAAAAAGGAEVAAAAAAGQARSEAAEEATAAAEAHASSATPPTHPLLPSTFGLGSVLFSGSHAGLGRRIFDRAVS